MAYMSDALLQVWHECLLRRRIDVAPNTLSLRWCRVVSPSADVGVPAPTEADVALLGSLLERWEGRASFTLSDRPCRRGVHTPRAIAPGVFALPGGRILSGIEVILFKTPRTDIPLFSLLALAGVPDVLLFDAVRSVLSIGLPHRRAGVEHVHFDQAAARVVNCPAFWLSLARTLWPRAQAVDYGRWASSRPHAPVRQMLEGHRRVYAVLRSPFIVAEGRRRLCVTVRNSVWMPDGGTLILISYMERRGDAYEFMSVRAE